MTAAAVELERGAGAPGRVRARRHIGAWLTIVVPALVAYVPLLLTQLAYGKPQTWFHFTFEVV